MDIEEARKLLSEEGLKMINKVAEYEDGTVYLCKRRNGTEIEAAIQDGIVVVAPT